MNQALSFNDVLIIPKYSEVLSRSDCNTSIDFTPDIQLQIPVLSSPMDTITEWQMAKELDRLGGLGVIHRFMPKGRQLEQVQKSEATNVSVAVGITGDYQERVKYLHKHGVRNFTLDVAHGHHVLMKKALQYLRKTYGNDIYLIAGNIATREGAMDLAEWGANALRSNIGSGSLCSTKIQTGVGIPAITTLLEVSDAINAYYPDVKIIADGGVKTSGDFCKAIAAGADAVMIGSLFAGTKETPGEIIQEGVFPNEKLYKQYRGSASFESKLDRGEDNHIEGVSKKVPYKGKVKRIIQGLSDGLHSAMSYVGANDIEEFQIKSEFIMITNAGYIESTPHLLER